MKLGEKIRYLRSVEGTLRGLGRDLNQAELARAIGQLPILETLVNRHGVARDAVTDSRSTAASGRWASRSALPIRGRRQAAT